MTQLREKHVGLRTGNKGRFASSVKPEGAQIQDGHDYWPVSVRHDLDVELIRSVDARSQAGSSVLRISRDLDLPAPVIADILDSLKREQITADDGVPPAMVEALKAAGVSSCHVERMKRGKMNLLVSGLRIRAGLDASGLLEYQVGGETITSESEDDHDAWVTALMAEVDHQAVKTNVSALLSQGKVSLKMNNYNGSSKGEWSHNGHLVKFELSAQGNVTFDSSMAVEDGHALQKDLGVTNAKQVTPLIARLRSRLSAAHRWALWHPSLDTYRHAARPGLKDSFEYRELREQVESKLEEARSQLFDTQEGVVIETSSSGYVAQVLVSSQREPIYFINDQEAYGLDDTKTNQRELAKFLRSHLEDIRVLDVGRRNGLNRSKS